LTPKLTYPSFFEGGLVGAAVKEPIAYREAFVYVPFHAIISIDKCRKDKVLGPFYKKNSQLFERSNSDWEQLTLTVFLVYQKQIGKKSYWAPYIESMPDVTFFCHESRESI